VPDGNFEDMLRLLRCAHIEYLDVIDVIPLKRFIL
jgi:hypothetical protein